MGKKLKWKVYREIKDKITVWVAGDKAMRRLF